MEGKWGLAESLEGECISKKLNGLSLFWSRKWWYAVGSHIGAKHFGDKDGTVGLLIIFHQRQPCAADGQARTVERVRIIALTALGLEADAAAAGLKCFANRAGRNLAEFAGGGQPHLEIIGFCGGETNVAGRKRNDAVVQAKDLQQ